MRPVRVREGARRHLSVWACGSLVTSLPRGIDPPLHPPAHLPSPAHLVACSRRAGPGRARVRGIRRRAEAAHHRAHLPHAALVAQGWRGGRPHSNPSPNLPLAAALLPPTLARCPGRRRDARCQVCAETTATAGCFHRTSSRRRASDGPSISSVARACLPRPCTPPRTFSKRPGRDPARDPSTEPGAGAEHRAQCSRARWHRG